MSAADWRAIACPFCLVAAGELCRTRSNGSLAWRPHQARVTLASMIAGRA